MWRAALRCGVLRPYAVLCCGMLRECGMLPYVCCADVLSSVPCRGLTNSGGEPPVWYPAQGLHRLAYGLALIGLVLLWTI